MSDGTKIALFLGGLLVLGGLGYGLYRFSQKHPHRYLPTATSPGVPQLPAAGASGVTVTTTTASSSGTSAPVLEAQPAPTPPDAHTLAPSGPIATPYEVTHT